MIIHVHFPRWLTTINARILTYLGHLKVMWKVWDLRTFTLVSLALQTILIMFAPFRKKTANLSVIVSIWLAYLLADYVATQAVGLVPKSAFQNTTTEHVSVVARSPLNATALAPHADLLAFWSPFLLVHLGGPDTITALALEDNELWMRTMLHLCTQVSATSRVFFQALPNSLLWLPTVLMFVAGFLKYLERTLSLYYARLTKFKSSMLKDPDPGPNYAKLMESYDSYKKSELPANFSTTPEPDQYKFVAHSVSEDQVQEDTPEVYVDPVRGGILEWLTSVVGLFTRRKQRKQRKREKKTMRNVQLVRKAFELFEKYKGLYVDLIFSFRDRSETRAYFLERNADEAFKLVETELNFTYEVFYTKMVVIHQTFGTVLRCVSCACEVLALLIWILFIDKSKFHPFDVRITYTLLGGAIVLDVIASLRVLLSDWKIALLNKESEVRAFFFDKLLHARNRTWGRYWGKEECPFMPYLRRIFFRRWSESVMQFNLINYNVDPWSKSAQIFFKIVPFQDKFDEFFVSKKWFADELRDFIFKEIKYKAEIAEDPNDAEEVCESKGDWILRSLAGLDFDPFQFYPWTVDVEYDECLLLWHIATELLYQEKNDDSKSDLVPPKENFFNRFFKRKPNSDNEKKVTTEKDYRKYCKTLSDYMMYLLNRQEEMMFAVAGISEVRFRDTCAEAIKFFDRVLPKSKPSETKEARHKLACRRIMDVNTENNPRDIKGDRSKSVLFDACRLAKTLKKLEAAKVKKWELMATVWVELVCYSATHCRANAHAAQLKQGGELLTLVWLLMVHLGLGRQFRITQGNARAKLIISK